MSERADKPLSADHRRDELLVKGGAHAQAAEGGLMAVVNAAGVTYERLPMLEVVFDRLERMLTTSLRHLTSENVEIELESLTAQRFGDYLAAIPVPAMIAIFRAVEWDNFGLVTVDSPMIYTVVDLLLGGRRGTVPTRIEGRAYTTIEAALAERLVRLTLNDLGLAFGPVAPGTFRFERMETNPRFAAITRAGNVCIVARLRIDMDDRGGVIEFLIPYATLEPVRDLLLQMFVGEKFGRDAIWENHLARQIDVTEVDLEAVMDELTLDLFEVLDLEVGSVLTLGVRPEDPVLLRCGDVPLLRGRVGQQNGRIAIQIEERLAPEGEPRHG